MKKTILIIVILAIIGALFLMFKSKTNTPAEENTNAPTTQNQADNTEIATINKDIESISIGDTDQEFKDIDTDLKSL